MVEVSKQINAVTRAFREDERDGTRVLVQTLTQTFTSDLADVWDALTNEDRIARWFLPVSGDLQIGGRYQLEGNAGGEILECTPPVDGHADYRVTWEMGGGVTWLSMNCSQKGPNTTTVELEHTAPADDLPPGMWDTFGPGATGVGWDGGMLGLALHLGEIEGSLAPEEAAAWAVTEEGKSFYREAADAWARAHIAGGADADAARRAADATFGFYTGQAAPGE